MKGWLDNFGKADNANDSNVSLPEGFVGLGYNTKGRNYSPAWGGQFQDGGELIPIAQSGKFIPSSLTQQVQQAVQPTVKPTATVPYLQTKDPAEFYKSWIQSPEYEQRLKATGYGNLPDRWLDGKDVGGVDYTKQQRLDLLENIKPFEYNKYKKSEAKPFDIGGPTININPLDYEGSSRQSIEAHEIAHVGTPTMSYQESEIIRNSMLPMAEPKLSGVQGSKEREASKSALEDYQHSQKPEEVKADLDALRFMMYDKGIYDITKGQKFTESDFEKAKQNLGKDRVFKRLENRMGKKNFVKLMNTIASADSEELPMAMGGMSIPGSVGFTYARTAGSAPSKGKYAKKTMASAQIGKNIEKDETNIDTNIASKIAGLELQQNPEYQYLKYLQGQPQLNQAPGRGEELIRQGLGYADVATDVMQMGNFIPLPQTQTIGKIGNIAGSIVDLTQAAMAAYNKDYQSALINAASAGLPFVIKNPNILGGYNRSAKYAFGNRSSYLPVDKRYGRMTEKQLLGNRALLGILGAETAYDAGAIGPVKKEYGGEIPSAQKGKNDIERISINDPRYPEMYKNRQVGLSYDGTISLPALDEVTITAPRSYTMDSLRDFTSAALYGAPATAMKLEAIPQAAMTETIEMLRGRPYDFSNVNPNIGSFSSNQRDLSQTLGYENPEGFLQNAVNLGLSAIDPVIISGASKVAGKQLAKKAVKAVDLDDVAKRKIHLQKLKDEKLIHPDTDINRYSKSLSDTEELTKKALTQRETYYRGVTPKIPEGPEQQLIIEEMTKAGVDISNPEDVGRYMATHVPFQKLDYNAGFATNDPRYNALYTSGGFSRYGDMTFEMTRPLDFSKGSYSNWLDELYKYPVYNPSEKIDDLPLFTRAYALENRPGPGVFVGTKGQKIFDDARLITDDYGRIKSKPLPGLEDVRINEDSQLKIGNVGKTNVLGEVVNRSITPIGYDPFTVLASPAELLTPNFLKFKPKTHATKNRLDAWRLYNGLEPNYNTFSKNADNTLSINDFRIEKDKLQSIVDNPKSSFGTIEIEPEFNFGGVHGNGLITKGVDEQGRKFIDFTDTWDLQPLQPIKGLPKKLKEFEVSSLTGGQPFDLKNRIYYDDAGNFFDHNNNKLIEKVESFPKGVVKENEPADVVMLTTPKIADEKQMDVLKDWENAQNNKYFKGAGVGAVGTLGGLSYMHKKSKEKEKSEDSKNEVPKKQNGGEMKFYQNGLDWKPKSMQRGGDAEKISINDPRYPELYKNRQVGSYYDGAFTLPDLPEFVVEGKDESLKEAMSQGSGRFLQGLAGVIGAPQAVTMELLTGKQQTPSEAFGFQQPGGWLDSYSSFGKNLGNFAMDAVLDPVNLLGVGLVDDVARASARVIANKPIQQFGRAAGSSDKVVFDLMDESIDPFGEVLKNVKIDNTPSSFAEDVRREALDYQQLTRDPRYLERVRRIDRDFGSNMESLLNSFNRSETADGKFFPFNISVVDEIPAGDQYTFDSSMGVSGLTDAGFKKFSQPGWKMPWPFNRSHRNALPIDPATDRYVQIAEKAHLVGNQPARGTVQHELKHHWTNALLDANNQNYGQGLKSFIAPRRSVVADPRDQIANKNYNYLSGSTEVDAFLMTEMRDEMVKRGYLKDHFDELTENKLNEFLTKEKDYRGAGEYFNPSKPMVADKSKFVDFFNKYGLPSTVIGGVLGGQAIDKQKNGGITKDNRGYWNPDNWGKPVEIDSNMITMQGVYEPLLGVSDTGDTKLMQPGKNYKFKGKKVTEYPVAKLGINQLDAQPMKKLNQLLNFTNNPDKDNWLDKYN